MLLNKLVIEASFAVPVKFRCIARLQQSIYYWRGNEGYVGYEY